MSGRDGPRQLRLFGDDPEAVEPAPVAPQLRMLAAQLPVRLRLGTSSWSFGGWAGSVYAPKTPSSRLPQLGLCAYAQHPLLRAVGIDRTFYAPLAAGELAHYGGQVPADFRFLVKAWSGCTTPFVDGKANPHYLDVAVAVERVVAPARDGLGDKLGTILFQFPPQGSVLARSPAKFAERLQGFLAALPAGPAYAVELRDPGLVGERYFAALRAVTASHCYSVHARMPEIAAQRRLAPAAGPTLVRWMLQPPLGYQEAQQRFAPFAALAAADPGRRRAIAELCADSLDRGDEAMVIINNKAEGSAPLSVFALAEAIAAELSRRRLPG